MMKAVHFHESVNQSIGNNKTSLPAKRKGKQRGKKMDIYELHIEFGKAAGVYENFKDPNQHQKIIEFCTKDHAAKLLVKDALKCILGKDLAVEDGLSDLSSVSSAVLWKDLSKYAKQSLRLIARGCPQLVKKVDSSIATTSSSATISTSNTGQFKGVCVEDAIPAAFQVVLGVAHKKATSRGLEKTDVDEAFGKLFWTDSEEYAAAYDAVVLEKGRKPMPKPQQRLWDLMESAIAIVNRIDVASQNRDDSTEATDIDQLYMAAMDAFSSFVKNDDISFSGDQIGDLMNIVLKPTTPNY